MRNTARKGGGNLCHRMDMMGDWLNEEMADSRVTFMPLTRKEGVPPP
jgi:hypothetical protein